jgi:hypothetical protein
MGLLSIVIMCDSITMVCIFKHTFVALLSFIKDRIITSFSTKRTKIMLNFWFKNSGNNEK